MYKVLSWAALLMGAVSGGSAAAAGGSATDQAVSLTYGATHWGGTPVANLSGVEATGDPVYHVGWWYRAEGDTREFPLPAPDTETYVNGAIKAVWNNLDGKGFSLEENTYVFDTEGPSGGFISHMLAQNNNASAKQFRLFHYLDLDVAGSGIGDSGTLASYRFLKFSDGTSHASYRSSAPMNYQVAAYPALLNALNDTFITTLSNSGMPFGPADATAAYEYGATLQPGVTYGLALVSAFFNPTRDHVKGDYAGVLGTSPLFAQPPNLSSHEVQWMRRTTQVNSPFSLGAPSANCDLAGVDDFYGNLSDQFAFRDRNSGVAYIGYSPITGAPTLPLNWKLSATGDFNGDGKADILWRNTTSQKLVIWTMNGPAKVGAIIPNPDQAVDANWEVAAASDFNGDGARDLLWYNQTTGKIVIWYMNASVVRITGVFTNPSSVGNNNWRVLAVGDFGKGPGGIYDTQDIVWQNDTSKKVVVWHMDQAANRTGGVFITPDTLSSGLDLVGPR